MNWLFWVLLILGIVLLIAPLLGVLDMTVAALLWLAGGVIVIGAVIWAVAVLSRSTGLQRPVEDNA
ncbi:MAG: hypothetical protein ACYDCO_23505 [Armatimonadota bacterium]